MPRGAKARSGFFALSLTALCPYWTMPYFGPLLGTFPYLDTEHEVLLLRQVSNSLLAAVFGAILSF